MNRDPVRYRHTQTGWWLRFCLYAIALLAFGPGIVASRPGDWTALFPFVGLALAMIFATLFSMLSVEVTDAEVRWYYGAGWPLWDVSRLLLESAESADIDYRLGIWWRTPRGVAYQVATGEAVALATDETEYLISTDDSVALLRALGAMEPA